MNLGEVLAMHQHVKTLIIKDTVGNIEDCFTSSMVDISILSCQVYKYSYKPATREMHVTIEV